MTEEPMTFHGYLRRCRVSDTAIGDFISDARADTSLPNAKTWHELQSYLIHRSACDGALRAAREVWSNFRRSESRRLSQADASQSVAAQEQRHKDNDNDQGKDHAHDP